MMKSNTILLYENKKTIELKPTKVAFYLQSKIVEAFNNQNEVFYLFFYKNQYLTAFKATKLRRRSFLERAFKSGIVFNSPHPMVDALLSTQSAFHIVTVNHLTNKLDLSNQEKAFILTFFDAVYSKKQLFEDIKKYFSVHRRNGQFFLGYKIVRILMDFAPKHRLIKSLSKDLIFNKYAHQYHDQTEEIFNKDLIFAEKTFYSNRSDDLFFNKLINLLEKDSRTLDIIALSIQRLIETPTTTDYGQLLNLLQQHFTKEDITVILERLSHQLPDFTPLYEDLFKMCIEQHKTQALARVLNSFKFTLNEDQVGKLAADLENFDLENTVIEPNDLIPLIKPVIQQFPNKREPLLKNFITQFLQTHDHLEVQEWLMTIDDHYASLPIYQKLEKMAVLSDDLDQMDTLGELYYEFGLLDKAIDCFNWEMELKPSDPKPIQWLAKIYQGMGMSEKSNDYRKLSIAVQKFGGSNSSASIG